MQIGCPNHPFCEDRTEDKSRFYLGKVPVDNVPQRHSLENSLGPIPYGVVHCPDKKMNMTDHIEH